MTEDDKCKALIEKIENNLHGETIENCLRSLLWVMGNVIVHAVHKDEVLPLSARMATEFLSIVLHLSEDEEEETMQ